MLDKAFFALELLFVVFLTVLLACSCSMKQWYPSMGAVVGGGVGSLAGPTGSALGAGSGALIGEVAKGNAEIAEARDTISALSHGDVEALVAKGMVKHQTSFDSFVLKIQRLLLIVGACLIVYLAIPVFVAKRCAQTETKKSLTRAPFPRPSDKL